MTERVIDPARLDFIDVVTSSHNHTDHLDAETLVPLRHANPDVALVIPEVNRAFVAERLGVDPAWPVGVAIGEQVEVGPFRIEAVPAAHEELDPQYVGYVVRCGAWTLYHSGDTVRYDGMAERLRPHAIDVALLPINGRSPERRVAGQPGRARGRAARSRHRRARGHPVPLRDVHVQHRRSGHLRRGVPGPRPARRRAALRRAVVQRVALTRRRQGR